MSTQKFHNHVVVGVDGSDASIGAALWAGALAHRLGSELVLVYAIPQNTALYSSASALAESQVIDALRQDATEIVEAGEAAVRAAHPDVAVHHLIGMGPAGTLLVEVAANARMVVVGSTGAGAVRALLLGSTALHVANKAPCPVTVWRGARSQPDNSPIVVGVDGSALSSSAVDISFELAAFFDAPVVAVHTWQGSPGLGPVDTDPRVSWEAVSQEEHALLSERLSGTAQQYPDIDVRKVAEQGGAAETLLRESENAQLIVVGSHGRGPLLGAVMGSTSQNLLHHARCPVTVCRQ
ncbi:MAG: universal stress protein [Rhodococcus sp.]|nr:universal stress protein [Rhodococcus sp. (in: high G+C Gram-positive bacteria)]